MKRNMIDVLKVTHGRLKNEDVKWVVSGSVSLLLQNIVKKASDIDIMTDKKGAYRIGEIFKR